MDATMDLRLLAIFVAVADASSFSRAAEKLGVTTATVSRGIARLEEAAGARLFHRSSRNVALSTAGAALYERAAPHVSALRDAVSELPERGPEPSGALRLTAPYELGITLLGELLARYTLRYPKVRVEADFSHRNVDLVAEGFDLAVRGTDARGQRDSSLTVQTVVPSTRLQLYAAPSYLARRGAPRAFGAPEHDWLFFRPLRRSIPLPEAFVPRIEVNDLLVLREAARAGAGIGPLPAAFAAPLVERGELARVLESFEPTLGGLVLLYPSKRPLPRKVTAFRDMLVEALKEAPF